MLTAKCLMQELSNTAQASPIPVLLGIEMSPLIKTAS